MKNFVIATVSMVALLGASANAQENPHEMKEGKPMAEHHMHEGHKDCPTHHKHHKHHKHHAHHKHHGHHHHGHHAPSHPLAVRVNFPPVSVAALSACPCEYYQGNQAHAYMYHEGYYWYPHARADMLAGYAPHHIRGSYWYPSRIHPHGLYVEGQALTHPDIYPVEMGEGMAHHMGKHAHHHHKGHHMGKHAHHVRHHNPGAPGMHMSETPMQGPNQPVAYEAPTPLERPPMRQPMDDPQQIKPSEGGNQPVRYDPTPGRDIRQRDLTPRDPLEHRHR